MNNTYQELILRDEMMRLQAPPEIVTYLNTCEVISPSGHHSKVEGGYFVLENINRKVKMLMPPGVPTDNAWLRSCRNLPKLEQMKNNILMAVGAELSVPFQTVTDNSLSPETEGWRSWLRQSNHLQASPCTPHLTGLDEEHLLDPDVQQWLDIATNRRKYS
ncbi:uncharacterized protein LOC124149778 [Haliotis rufescens]|uniref:uncharacterized protein LOC124149778 n=1 Tax=Haliotis rufescens TaxID=6454 RepID=UPI00201F7A32|nr:uncharacterized protein LOC124149778 [Haliotis rufescens]